MGSMNGHGGRPPGLGHPPGHHPLLLPRNGVQPLTVQPPPPPAIGKIRVVQPMVVWTTPLGHAAAVGTVPGAYVQAATPKECLRALSSHINDWAARHGAANLPGPEHHDVMPLTIETWKDPVEAVVEADRARQERRAALVSQAMEMADSGDADTETSRVLRQLVELLNS